MTKDAPANIRIVSACLLAELKEDDPESVEDACRLLVDSVGAGEDNALPIGKSFISLAGQHSSAGADGLARKTIAATTRTADPVALRTLSEAVAVLASKLSAEESLALAFDVLHRAGKNSTPETLPTLSKTFSVLAGKVSPGRAPDLARTTTQLASETTDPDVLGTLTKAFVLLAAEPPLRDGGQARSDSHAIGSSNSWTRPPIRMFFTPCRERCRPWPAISTPTRRPLPPSISSQL